MFAKKRGTVPQPRYTDRQLIDALVAEVVESGHMPTFPALDSHPVLASGRTYRTRLGSSKDLAKLVVRELRERENFVLAAAIELECGLRDTSVVIAEVMEVVVARGRMPTLVEIDADPRLMSYTIYHTMFGGTDALALHVIDALRGAGNDKLADTIDKARSYNWTDDKLLTRLSAIVVIYGRMLRYAEIDAHPKLGKSRVYRLRFDGEYALAQKVIDHLRAEGEHDGLVGVLEQDLALRLRRSVAKKARRGQ